MVTRLSLNSQVGTNDLESLLLISKWVLDESFSSNDMIDFSQLLLSKGCSEPLVIEIASTFKDTDDIDVHVFREMLDQSGYQLPDRVQAGTLIAYSIARQVVDNEYELLVGCQKIDIEIISSHRELKFPLLVELSRLVSDYDDLSATGAIEFYGEKESEEKLCVIKSEMRNELELLVDHVEKRFRYTAGIHAIKKRIGMK